MISETESLIADLIDKAENMEMPTADVVEKTDADSSAPITEKPNLIVHGGNLPATAHALRDLLATSRRLFDRGVPVTVVQPADDSPPIAMQLTANQVVMEAHRLCRPLKLNKNGELVAVTLPDRL